MSNSTIEHFTHPGHELVKFDSNKEYLCDGCKAPGSGKTVGCSSCNDFNMHEFCGECPKELSTFMHPLHHLSLVVRKGHGMRTNERTCDVCGDDLEGLFYRCKDCDFDLHPLCTQLPQELTHALHTDHPLVLQKPKSDGRCCVCNGVCKSWRYRCGKCDDFDIHLECVTVEISCATTRQLRVPLPFTPQTPPLHSGYAYGGVLLGNSRPPQPPLHGGYAYSRPPQPPLHGGYAYGEVLLGNSRPPQPPLHGGYAYGGLPFGNSGPPQPPLDGGYSYGGVPTGNSGPLPPTPLHGGYTYGGVPQGNYGPYYNMYYSGLVNNQAYNIHNPAYYHDQVNAYNESNHAYAQAYNYMYNPANNMYSSYGGVPLGQNLCNNIYCSPYGCNNSKPQAYNNMNNSCVGVPLAYGNYQYPEISTQNYENQDPAISTQNSENQDHHTGAQNETQNCANHDHHLGAGSTKRKVFKKMFKIVGALTLGVVSNVIFGISFPGL